MKIKLPRRLFAAAASVALALVAVPAVSTSASAADACGLGETCTGALSGDLGTTQFEIRMPEKFNGTVLLYSHGYRLNHPIPAQIATLAGLNRSPYYSETQVPGLGAAYVGNDLPQVAQDEQTAAQLLAQGYALAGAGYADQGWASAEGVEAGELLIRHINGGAVAGVDEILAWGDSLGAVVTQALVQRNPGKIAGTLPMCGALAGPEQAFQTAMTAMFAWKTLIAPNLKVANYTPGTAGYVEAVQDLGTVFTTIAALQAESTLVAETRLPVALSNLLAGLIAGLPTQGQTFDGISVNPAVAELGTAAAIAGGYSPLSAGANSASAMVANVANAAIIGIMGRYDLEMRARQGAQIPPSETANFSDNVPVVYSELLTLEQRREFEDTFNSVSPGLMDVMLGALDRSLGSETARFPANPKAVEFVRGLPSAQPVYRKPVVIMTTTIDPLTPAGNTYEYYEALTGTKAAERAAQRGTLKAVQYFTVPADLEYTKFEPGAKSPSAALSAQATGGSGVGHCTFTTNQKVGAIRTLDRLVDAKTPKQIAAAKRVGYRLGDVIRDRLFEPPLLKRPLETAN
jgi:pimeloyl-ACP methyl ester carboxylesterase